MVLCCTMEEILMGLVDVYCWMMMWAVLLWDIVRKNGGHGAEVI
jgi:hypothetical protein